MEDDDYNPQRTGEGYAWEEEYKRSWDILQEDEDGSIKHIVQQLQQTKKRKIIKDKPIKRGIIRHTVLIIDCSRSMVDMDLRPNRLECTLDLVKEFITEYFDQNPLSLVMIIGIRDGLAERWTTWSGNPTEIIQQLNNTSYIAIGEPSIQNALELGRQTLLHVPSHASREILMLYGSLSR
jgi:transcription initiation factor TFIIH subunit 2